MKINLRRLLTFLWEDFLTLIEYNLWTNFIGIIWLRKLLMLFKANSVCYSRGFASWRPFISELVRLGIQHTKKQWGQKGRGLFILRTFFPSVIFSSIFFSLALLFPAIFSTDWFDLNKVPNIKFNSNLMIFFSILIHGFKFAAWIFKYFVNLFEIRYQDAYFRYSIEMKSNCIQFYENRFYSVFNSEKGFSFKCAKNPNWYFHFYVDQLISVLNPIDSKTQTKMFIRPSDHISRSIIKILR